MGSSDFNVSVKLDAIVAGVQEVRNFLSTVNQGLASVASGNASVSEAVKKTRDALAGAQKEAAKLAASTSQALKSDTATGMRKGLATVGTEVKKITSELRNLSTVKVTGKPTANLDSSLAATEGKIKKTREEFRKLKDESSGSGAALASPGGAGGLAGIGMGSLIGGLTAANLATQAIIGSMRALKNTISSVVSEGIAMNEFLEISKFGLATSINAQYAVADATGKVLEGQESYNASLAIADEQLKEIRIAGLQTAATSQQLVKSFQTTMAVGASQGIKDLTQLRQLTIDVTNAATALGVAQDVVPMAIRGVITGREVEENQLARILVGTGAQVRLWQQQGVLVEKLNERLKPFSLGAAQAAKSWSVVKSNIQESFQVFSGQVTAGLFGKVKAAASEALEGMFDIKTLGITSKFGGIVDLLKNMFDGIGQGLSEAISAGLRLAEELSDWIKKNKVSIDEWYVGLSECWVAVKGLLVSIGAILSALGQVGDRTDTAANKFSAISLIIKGIALIIAGISDGLRMVVGALMMLGAGLTEILVKPMEYMVRSIGEALNTLKKGSGAAFIDLANGWRDTVRSVGIAGSDLWKPVVEGTGAVKTLLNEFEKVSGAVEKVEKKMTLEQARTAIKSLTAEIEKLNKSDEELLNGEGGAADSAALEANMKRRIVLTKELGRVSTLYPQIVATKYPVTSVVTGRDATSAKAKAQADAEISLAKEQAARLQRNYDDAYANGLFSISEYYTNRLRVQQEALRKEEEIIQSELDLLTKAAGVGTATEQGKNETERIKLQGKLNSLRLQEGNIIADNHSKELAATEALAAKVLEVRAALEQATGNATNVTVEETITQKFEKQLIQFKATYGEGSEPVISLENLIDVEKAKAKLAILQRDFSNAMQKMQTEEQLIAQQRLSGTITQEQEEEKLNALHLKTASDLEALAPAMQEYANIIKDPAVVEALRQQGIEIEGMKKPVNELKEQVKGGLTNSFTDFFASIADGTKTAGQAFNDLGRSILSMIAQIIAQKMALKLVESIGFASGGPIQKFASGGAIFGAGTSTSDSIPIMASAGEFMINAKAVRRVGIPFLNMINGLHIPSRTGHYANGGPIVASVGPGSAVPPPAAVNQVNLKIANVWDKKQIQDAMKTREGEQLIINAASNNVTQFRAALGIA